jgi:hypothetical protein
MEFDSAHPSKMIVGTRPQGRLLLIHTVILVHGMVTSHFYCCSTTVADILLSFVQCYVFVSQYS